VYLSATAMKDWLECPQRLEYRLAGEPQQATVYMLRGTAVHETIENQGIQTFEDAKQFFFIRFSELLVENQPEFPYNASFASMTKQSYIMLDNYYNIINVTEPPIKSIELQFNVEINGVAFAGRIDQIRGNNIYDWKTKTDVLDKVFINTDYQFTLYGMAYKELFGDYPDNIYYGHLFSGKLISMERSRKDYKYLEEIAGKIEFAANNKIFPRNYGKYTC
jgi:hypothetical protein